ncbi:cation diffusion facilitator family transporter [Candidatus Neomarinimicrobiota bacterium]
MNRDLLDRRYQIRSRLWIAFALNAGFMVVELLGGLWTGSMALLGDAGHMLTDSGAIGLALFANWLAIKPKNDQRTYGYLRAEILGAMMNGVFLILICCYILMEAWQRIGNPRSIAGGPVLIIATVGLGVNIASAIITKDGRKENLNLEGAFLHMTLDALGSIGAIIAGTVIILTGWTPIDTLASIFIAMLILWGGWQLLVRSADILMESTPAEIDFHEVEHELRSMEHIADLHDLHIWTISSGVLALSAHIQLTTDCIKEGHWPKCLHETQQHLHTKWGIEHTTLQTEPPAFKDKYE